MNSRQETGVSSITDIIADIKAGRMVVLVDEADRENEGDLLIAAEFVTPETINFMARYGRGLICLTLTEQKCRSLNLPLMVVNNRSPLGTNFTRLDRGGGRRYHRHFRGRPRAHRAGRDPAGRQPRRSGAARAHLPADGAGGRGAGARGPYRGRVRSRAAGGSQPRDGDLRDSQGQRRDGAAAGPDRIRRTAQAENRHHRRSHPPPQPDRVAGDTGCGARHRNRARYVPAARLRRQDRPGNAPRPDEGQARTGQGGAGARARAGVGDRSPGRGEPQPFVEFQRRARRA